MLQNHATAKSVIAVNDGPSAVYQLALTSLRNIIGQHQLDEVLKDRDKINDQLKGTVDQDTAPWGVKVSMVEVKQVDLAEQMIRALGKQAEAERERRAKIIHAEGEYSASEKLAMAAQVIQQQPAAIQLRYLQTLVEIGAEKNTTIVFPLPVDLLVSFNKLMNSVSDKYDADKIAREGEAPKV